MSRAGRRRVGYLVEAFGGRCCYCGRRVTPPGLGLPTDATRDHVRPRSLGGSADPANLVLACKACNALKGNLCLPVFLVLRWAYRGAS